MTIPTARAAGGPAACGSGKITREAVLAAALQIIDRDGAEALSMPAPGPSATRAQQSMKSRAAGSIIRKQMARTCRPAMYRLGGGLNSEHSVELSGRVRAVPVALIA